MKKSMVRQVNGTNVGIVGYIIEETKVISSSVNQFDTYSTDNFQLTADRLPALISRHLKN